MNAPLTQVVLMTGLTVFYVHSQSEFFFSIVYITDYDFVHNSLLSTLPLA